MRTISGLATLALIVVTACGTKDAATAVEGEAAPALDLHQMIADLEAGQIETAEDLELRLAAEGSATVDMDGDGQADRLHVVERRSETGTAFEIRAVGKASKSIEVEEAPLVARLELDAHADAGRVDVTAVYSPAYAASASVDVESTTVTHHVGGVVVAADGEVSVTPEATAFVTWAFRPGRVVFVAPVFVVHEHHHERDHCWPPGHCKHGKWKARGEAPPGHEKKHHDSGHVTVVSVGGHGPGGGGRSKKAGKRKGGSHKKKRK